MKGITTSILALSLLALTGTAGAVDWSAVCCDGGFEYSDASLPDLDARFVWSFVRSAVQHGAIAANYVESLGATGFVSA